MTAKPGEMKAARLQPTGAHRPAQGSVKAMRGWTGMAAASLLLGVAIAGADMYFGKGNGKTGAFLLGVLVCGGMAFEYLIAIHPLRNPRALDVDFVCGADYARRRAEAVRHLRSALVRQIRIPLAALGLLGLLGAGLGLGLFKVLGIGAVLGLESLGLAALMITSIRLGWIRISRKKFLSRESRAADAFGAATASRLIRLSHAVSHRLTRWIPGPERWLLRRKLLYLFRTDPVYLAIHLSLTAALAAQFNIAWGFNLNAVFTLANLALSLTLLQIAFREPDAYYGRCAHFLPAYRFDQRATLMLFAAISAALLIPFALGCFIHMGWADTLSSRAFWHVIITALGLPFLIAMEPPKLPGPMRVEWDVNARAVLNFCYLGLAGWLFMFSWPGVVVSGTVGALSALSFGLGFRRGAERA
jgi:hypothetical protein